MRLPELTEFASAKDNTEVFTGYNHNLRNSVGEWYDQKNMTTDYYPVASPREKRSIQTEIKDTQIKLNLSHLQINLELKYNEDGSTVYEKGFEPVFKTIYATGCHDLAYTDKKIITLQDIYDENNIQIGAWFTSNGKMAALKYLTPVYMLHDISVKQESNASLDSDPYDIFTFSGDELKNIDIHVGDHIEFYLSNLNDANTVNDFSKANGIVIEISDGGFVVKANKTFLMSNNTGPDAVVVNNTSIDEILSKFAYFDTNISKRSIVRMGSYICVFPDGVIYETANINDDIPVFKINSSMEVSNVTIQTLTKDNENRIGYIPIDRYQSSADEKNGYRIVDGQVQYYLEGTNMWVSAKTYVMLYVKNKENTFSNFSVNDAISIKDKTDGIPGDTLDGCLDGVISWNTEKQEFSEKTLKILEKGTLEPGEMNVDEPTDYIIVDGYMLYSYVSMGLKQEASYTEKSVITFTRKCPDIAFACESQNRIWCCSKDGHEIYASALGDPYNFYDYSGVATDSYAVNVGTDGAFTGCINYLGKPLFFKENALHYISGSYPSNSGSLDGMSYAVTTTTDFKGVEKGSEKSLAIIDNILYYKSSAGIVAYDGATTTIISDALGKEKYKNAVAGVYKNKYYVSMQDKQGTYHLFVYDTALGTWCKEDDTQVLQFLPVNNELLFSTADNNSIYCVSEENVIESEEYDKESDFDWYCETGNFGYSYPNNKYLSRFQIRMQIADGAKASIYIQYNSDGVWHRKGEMCGKGVKTYLIPIVPVRCDHMKIKIAGKGDVKIYSIAKIFEEGGDR